MPSVHDHFLFTTLAKHIIITNALCHITQQVMASAVENIAWTNSKLHLESATLNTYIHNSLTRPKGSYVSRSVIRIFHFSASSVFVAPFCAMGILYTLLEHFSPNLLFSSPSLSSNFKSWSKSSFSRIVLLGIGIHIYIQKGSHGAVLLPDCKSMSWTSTRYLS